MHLYLKKVAIPALTLAILLSLSSLRQEEGMFPLNYLQEKTLQDAGLKLNTRDIFNPEGVALTNALVKVGGCTGSFISDEGLIITNHHCVYGGVANMSTADNNVLENGFVAGSKEKEVSINMPCRITQSYEDVSSKVLEGIDDNTDPAVRSARIRENIKKVIADEKVKYPDLSNEVSEMFVGKSYMLFRYILITDVRLVFAPPVTIGQFGGDLDNWEWPRHNGDFSMVRAYVGKDGKPAPYSKDNIPYKPAKHLKINASGTRENDFVFIMGYPGRTFRHESAPYMQFQQDYHLPEIQKWYSWCIDQMEDLGRSDLNLSLNFAGTVQQLSNVEKNYRGKMQGLTRTGLVQRKKTDEQSMIEFAEKSGMDGDVIVKLNTLWKRKTELAPKIYTYNFLNDQSNLFEAAGNIHKTALTVKKGNAEEASTAKENLRSFLSQQYSITSLVYEHRVLNEILSRLSKIKDLKPLLGKMSTEEWVNQLDKKEKLQSVNWAKSMAGKTEKLLKYKSPMMDLISFISDDINAVFSEWANLGNQINALMPLYLDIKQAYKSSTFIPDANATLRLTYGYIKRYSPNDAEIHTPYTTLRGVFEKANTANDYRLPQVLADNLRVESVPPFFTDPETGEVIVCFLYNLDTTGGNSGSPVLDASGNLIGVNFDRSFTATINDYAWNDHYSRSIGVDIRYVLYVMKYVGKADHLLKEMNLNI